MKKKEKDEMEEGKAEEVMDLRLNERLICREGKQKKDDDLEGRYM